MKQDSVYVSRVHIVRSDGPNRYATLPTGESVTFGVHGGISDHYQIDIPQGGEHAATLDYVVAATAAAAVGTFARMLRDEGIIVGAGDLQADAVGVIGAHEGELVLHEIDIAYTVQLPRNTEVYRVERAHQRHAAKCPLIKTLGRCVDVRTAFEIASNQ